MTDNHQLKETFGCERCWPQAAHAAWEARRALSIADQLIEESHFHVMTLACPHCSQRFLSVFTETIDWDDGDDPQYWTLLPLTETEAADLLEQRDSLTEAKLESLGHGRRCLKLSHPKGAKPVASWGKGIFVGMHD
ncbi:MAG TPA: hypothetical protein VG675_24285 [Bryobacteraceae bacterium]|nr:hypothetical protein [Bryobacteraceae bacterium]